MFPEFLVPESTIRQAGTGSAIDLGVNAGKTLLLTLGITRIIEQESIDISIWGSSDGTNWSAKPLTVFSQKFYCGTYQMLLDLSENSEVKYLRAQWQVNRWGRGDAKPLFTVYLAVEHMDRQPAVAAAR